MTRTQKANAVLALALLLCGVLMFILIASNITIFEDGSWAFGQYPYIVTGCIPWNICGAMSVKKELNALYEKIRQSGQEAVESWHMTDSEFEKLITKISTERKQIVAKRAELRNYMEEVRRV